MKPEVNLSIFSKKSLFYCKNQYFSENHFKLVFLVIFLLFAILQPIATGVREAIKKSATLFQNQLEVNFHDIQKVPKFQIRYFIFEYSPLSLTLSSKLLPKLWSCQGYWVCSSIQQIKYIMWSNKNRKSIEKYSVDALVESSTMITNDIALEYSMRLIFISTWIPQHSIIGCFLSFLSSNFVTAYRNSFGLISSVVYLNKTRNWKIKQDSKPTQTPELFFVLCTYEL